MAPSEPKSQKQRAIFISFSSRDRLNGSLWAQVRAQKALRSLQLPASSGRPLANALTLEQTLCKIATFRKPQLARVQRPGLILINILFVRLQSVNLASLTLLLNFSLAMSNYLNFRLFAFPLHHLFFLTAVLVPNVTSGTAQTFARFFPPGSSEMWPLPAKMPSVCQWLCNGLLHLSHWISTNFVRSQ